MPKILEYINQAKEIADSMDNVALKSIILDLQEILLELQQENLQLKGALNQKNSFNMQFENNVYYNTLSNGQRDGPFCSCCWDVKNLAVRLHCRNDGYSCCPSCKREVWLTERGPSSVQTVWKYKK